LSDPAVIALSARSCCHHPRRRVNQYPRDVSDRTEKPQRTGSSAFAEDDSVLLGSVE